MFSPAVQQRFDHQLYVETMSCYGGRIILLVKLSKLNTWKANNDVCLKKIYLNLLRLPPQDKRNRRRWRFKGKMKECILPLVLALLCFGELLPASCLSPIICLPGVYTACVLTPLSIYPPTISICLDI